MSDAKSFPKWPLYAIIVLGLLIGLVYSFGMLQAVTGKHKAKDVGPFKMEFSSRGEQSVGMPARLTLLVVSDAKPKDVKLAYYSLSNAEARPSMVHRGVPVMRKEFKMAPMLPAGASGFYTAQLPPMEMAAQYYYYFIFTDDAGKAYNFPDGAPEKTNNITYRGDGVLWVTALHISMMVLVVLFLMHTIYYALMHIAIKEFPISKTIHSAFWMNIFFFITSFPIGLYVAWKAYGRPWTGIPEVMDPNDVDNKSLFIFIYWVIVLLLIKGVGAGKNKIGTKAFAVLSLIGAILTVYFFLSGGHN